ncbi:unnamed protein product [Symbiodinium sp. CCMP2592]|nr:unnamed protein product [Symbiodinium sp. CCMP2592]
MVLSHKQRTRQLQDVEQLYARVSQHIVRYVSTQPSDYFISDKTECIREAQIRATQRGVRVYPGADPNLDSLLLPRERRVLSDLLCVYRKKHRSDPYQDKNLVIHLGDSSERQCWSAASGRVPTFRATGGLLWSVPRSRWMTARERLAALGLPVTDETAAAMGVPKFPCLDVRRAQHVAGNSFHFSTVSVVQLVALLSFAKIEC